MKKRTCKKCNKEHELVNFVSYKYKNETKFTFTCKICSRLKHKDYYKKFYEKNKNKIDLKNKKYNNDHKIELISYRKEYRKKNKSIINDKAKEVRKNNIFIRLRSNVSASINQNIKKINSKKNKTSCLSFLTYSMQELKLHLESQFASWMNWNNYGKYISGWDDDDQSTWTWQIDHIIPQSDLPYTSMQDDNFKKCWALSNLRPYSSKQNMLDGSQRIRHGSM